MPCQRPLYDLLLQFRDALAGVTLYSLVEEEVIAEDSARWAALPAALAAAGVVTVLQTRPDAADAAGRDIPELVCLAAESYDLVLVQAGTASGSDLAAYLRRHALTSVATVFAPF
jgi:hypothetical protein